MSQSVWREWQDGAREALAAHFSSLPGPERRRQLGGWECEAARQEDEDGAESGFGPSCGQEQSGEWKVLPTPLVSTHWGWWLRWSWLGLPPAWASAGTRLSRLPTPVGAGLGLSSESSGVGDRQEAPARRRP